MCKKHNFFLAYMLLMIPYFFDNCKFLEHKIDRQCKRIPYMIFATFIKKNSDQQIHTTKTLYSTNSKVKMGQKFRTAYKKLVTIV